MMRQTLHNEKGWKSRLYGAYVSSGQAGPFSGSGPDESFRPRRAYISNVIKKHIPADRSISILDLGCGHGAFLHFLSTAGYSNCRGFDASVEQVHAAGRLGVASVLQATIDDAIRSIDDLTIDIILLIDVVEHLPMAELFALLDNVRRILRNGGKCILHCPNAEGLFGMRVRYGDLTHETAFTPGSVQQLFRTIGFSSASCYEDKPVVHGLSSCLRRIFWEAGTIPHRLLLLSETGTLGHVLSQNMLVVAVK